MLLHYLLASAAGLYLLWILYLAVMNLARANANGKLSKTAFVLGAPLLVTGLLVDVLANVFVLSIIMMEVPQEWTVSARLHRHNKESTGYRLAVVRLFEPLLDPFDPTGNHV